MSEPFIGEIRMFAGNFAPRSWAFCDGQLLAVSQNDALFSLLGTTYGGDGRTTFGLPDLRGRIPVHEGSGPGLTNRRLGQKTGEERVTITANQLPAHRHTAMGASAQATTQAALNNLFAKTDESTYRARESFSLTDMGAPTSNAGGGQPHDNMMPSLCINFIIALYGIYPSRT